MALVAPGQAGQRRRHGEHHQLVAVGGVAERDGARFVVANGLEHLAEGRMDDPVDDQHADEEDGQDDEVQGDVRAQV
jgi:hypothetical protein